MQYVRLYSDAAGESHFTDVEVALAPVAFIAGRPPVDLAPPVPAGWTSGGYDNPPRRNFFVTLQGALELEASDGEVRSFGPGTVWLAEDVTGRGHITRNPAGEWLGVLLTPAD